jgi:hypothetical protein
MDIKDAQKKIRTEFSTDFFKFKGVLLFMQQSFYP